MALYRDSNGDISESRRSPPRSARTAGEISKEVLSDAIQNPTTLFPLGLALAACMYAFLISPFVGGTFIGIAVAILAGLTGGGSFFYNYFIRGQEYAKQKADEDIARFSREQHEFQQASLQSLYNEVERGFSTNRSKYASEGLMALRELTRQYQNVMEKIGEHSADDSVLMSSTDTLSSLAHDTYMQGMHVLQDALGVMQSSVGERQSTRVKELLAKCGECQAALQHVSDELTNSHISGTQASVDSATDQLRTTIDVARRVERRLSGEDKEAEDRRFLELGRQQDGRTR